MDHPELIDDLKRVLETGEPIERELRGVRGKPFFLRILPYRAKGTVDGVVLTLIDVSGLKAAEDALFHERYLLNSLLFTVPDAIYFKDARGRFIRANHAMAERLGLADPREMIGRGPFELPEREPRSRCTSGRGRAAERRGAALQAREPRARRRRHRVGSRDAPAAARRARTHIVGIIAIFRSVTEQKLRRREDPGGRPPPRPVPGHALARAAQPARRHRHRHGAAQGDATSASEPRQRLLDVLERQSQQMARLLDDLLEASRVTQNKIELRRSVVDLRLVRAKRSRPCASRSKRAS